MKKLAFYIHDIGGMGGAERVMVNLINELVNNYQILVINDIVNKNGYSLSSKVKVIDLSTAHKSKNNLISNITSNYARVKKIQRICKTNEVNLIVAFTSNCAVRAILAAKKLRIPCIISERNNPIINPPNFFWQFLRDRYYPFSDFLIVQNKANQNFFENIMPSEKIKIIANPISKELANKRKTYNYNLREDIILMVGRLDQNKAQHILIEAFAKSDLTNWKLILVGDGTFKEKYQNLASDLKIENKVEFTGGILDVHDYYNRAKIFAFSSRSEGMPNALIEALYFGLPCISTNCPNGPSDLITNEENGFLIDVDDVSNLSSKLNLLANNQILCEKFSKQALVKTKKFELKNIITIWKNVIDKLLIKT